MGEQNRRAVDLEPQAHPSTEARPSVARPGGAPPDAVPGPDAADERQTARQAPGGASPGESAQDESIG